MDSRSLLRNRDFLIVASSVGLSAMGDWVAITALGLHVEEATGSGFAVAGLWICLFGPSVAVAGHAGLLVDRVEATRLLALVSVVGAAAAGVLAFVASTSAVLALTVVLGVVFALMSPAEFSLVPPLAGDRIQEANGHVETFRYLGFGIGPVLGGFMFAAGGLELAMIVDAATFAAVALAALALRIERRPEDLRPEDETPRARDGVAYLFRDRVLAIAMAVAFVSLLFMSAVWVAEIFFVKDVLEMGDTAFGFYLSVWTVGMALGALILSRRVVAGGVAAAGLAAVAVQGAGLALPALWLVFAFFLACAFVGGLAHGLKNVMFRSLIHVRVPAHLHGRAFAAYNGIRNAAELGAFAAGGVLVAAIGARGTIAYAGGLSALAGLVGLIVLLRVNRGWQSTGPVGPPAETLVADDAAGPASVADQS